MKCYSISEVIFRMHVFVCLLNAGKHNPRSLRWNLLGRWCVSHERLEGGVFIFLCPMHPRIWDGARGRSPGFLGRLKTPALLIMVLYHPRGGFRFFASPSSQKWYFGVGSDSIHHTTHGQEWGENTTLITW